MTHTTILRDAAKDVVFAYSDEHTSEVGLGRTISNLAAALATADAEGAPECLGMLTECPTCKNEISKCVLAAAPAAPIVATKPVAWMVQDQADVEMPGTGTRQFRFNDPTGIFTYVTPLYTHPSAEHAKPEPVEQCTYPKCDCDQDHSCGPVEQAKLAEGIDTPRFREILKRVCGSYGMLDVFEIEVSELLAYIGYQAGQQAGAVDGEAI